MKVKNGPVMSGEPLVSIRDLSIAFSRNATKVRALESVSLDIPRGQIVAVVGESGSGKSTLGMTLLGLLAGNGEIEGGSIEFDGQEMLDYSKAEWMQLRGQRVGLVPQDPMSNLNPTKRIEKQLGEVLIRHGKATKKTLRKECCRVLRQAGIPNPEERLSQFPHQLSGGLRQRVLVAIGVACTPELLIADEPTSALDVTVSARILDQIESISTDTGMSVLLITHDLGLAASRADRIVVMQEGRIVESGNTIDVISNPKSSYTKRLLEADPGVRARKGASINRRPCTEESEVIVEMKNLGKTYQLRRKDRQVIANKNVNFRVRRGTTVAIVGESGSGKTTAARMLLKLETPSRGTVEFKGKDIGQLSRAQVKEFRKQIQPIFQDPYSSLNPMMSVKNIVREGLDHYDIGDKKSRDLLVKELLSKVGLTPEIGERNPSELSGGQRQRVAIARAVSMHPEVLVCDEPVSALDVLVQKQVLDLLSELQEDYQLTYVFITHDLAVVREFADYVYVMRDGSVVEEADTYTLFSFPQEAYTKELLRSAGIPLEPADAGLVS